MESCTLKVGTKYEANWFNRSCDILSTMLKKKIDKNAIM